MEALFNEDKQMTLNEFRLFHSELIENYQFIEFNLEGIYAALSSKSFCEGLEDVEKTNLHNLRLLIAKMEKHIGEPVFTEEENIVLEKVIQERNFWVHNCYVDLTFGHKEDDGPRNEYDLLRLRNAIIESGKVRDWLFDKKIKLMHEKR